MKSEWAAQNRHSEFTIHWSQYKSRLDIQSHNSIAIIALSPDVGYPRLTGSVMNELSELLATIQRESLFSGVVIAPNSQSFAIGADIEELAELGGITAREFALAGQGVFRQIEVSRLPVVAAVRGFCLGGGLDLALACHARVATYDSSFGHPGGSLGLLTGWGGTQRLQRLVGRAHALQMLLTGDRLPATQAMTLGLVDELVPAQDLVEAAARRARQLAAADERSSFHWLRT